MKTFNNCLKLLRLWNQNTHLVSFWCVCLYLVIKIRHWKERSCVCDCYNLAIFHWRSVVKIQTEVRLQFVSSANREARVIPATNRRYLVDAYCHRLFRRSFGGTNSLTFRDWSDPTWTWKQHSFSKRWY